MGNEASKHKHKSVNKLGVARPAPINSASQQVSQPTAKPTPTGSSKSQLVNEARPVGTSGSGSSVAAKEASARAAEERFKKLQEQKQGQKERIRTKAMREKAI